LGVQYAVVKYHTFKKASFDVPQLCAKTKQEEDGFPRSKKLTRGVSRADATMEVVVVLGLGVFPLSFVM
jgi:hypothetical protein